MPLEELTTRITTRRTITKTGVKLAYAAPVLAASMRLSAGGAGAVSPGGTCFTFTCGQTTPCFDQPAGFDCWCFETVENPGVGKCVSDFFCGGPTCASDADCGGGTCVTNTCCGSGVQVCAPPCVAGAGGESVGTGPTASGR